MTILKQKMELFYGLFMIDHRVASEICVWSISIMVMESAGFSYVYLTVQKKLCVLGWRYMKRKGVTHSHLRVSNVLAVI